MWTVSIISQENITRLEIETDRAGVKVYLDGDYQGETTLQFGTFLLALGDVRSGNHVLKCTFPGFNDWQKTVFVEKDKANRQEVSFEESSITVEALDVMGSGQLEAETGTIEIVSIPSKANVDLDGKKMVSATDIRLNDIPIGQHTVDVYFNKSDPKQILQASTFIKILRK